ncbi:12478_t:CDS:2 [Gigaspora rosea]|nr:12478_t:CDS:2 [Gigaspora rosea]
MFALRPASLRAISRIVTSRIFRPKLVTARTFNVKPLYQEENPKLSDYQRKKLLLKKKFADEFVAKVTRPAPYWEASAVVGEEIKTLSLNDFEDKFLIMLFYPLDFTFVCPTELNAFSDRSQEFKDIGAEVVAISCDSEFSHLAWRGTVIIDDKGAVRVVHINDTPIGRSVDEVLRLVQAIQFTNDYGEVCPANWKKGDATIVPDPKKSMSYFSTLKTTNK